MVPFIHSSARHFIYKHYNCKSKQDQWIDMNWVKGEWHHSSVGTFLLQCSGRASEDHIRLPALGQLDLIDDQTLFKGMAVCTALPCWKGQKSWCYCCADTGVIGPHL